MNPPRKTAPENTLRALLDDTGVTQIGFGRWSGLGMRTVRRFCTDRAIPQYVGVLVEYARYKMAREPGWVPSA